MDAIPGPEPEDARPPVQPVASDQAEHSEPPRQDARPEVALRGQFNAGVAVLTFPLAFFPPFILAVVLIHHVPGAVGWAITVLGTAALWTAMLLRHRARFTDEALVVDLLFTRRRIPWAAVSSASFEAITDSETDEVHYRVVNVRYRRNPGQPLPELPSRLGDALTWSRTHFQSVRLPGIFPPPQTAETPRRPVRDSRLRRRRALMRETLRRELAARGFDLPD